MTQDACPVCQLPLEQLTAHLGCAARPHAPELPERIGPYPIVRAIGSGGMGSVYAGQQHCPAREVAIKVISDGVFADDALREKFLREREIAGSFEHPNIIRVYEAGEDADRQPYYVMELAQRGTLRDFLQQESLSLRDAVRLTVEVALAVDHAHERGVLHRDLKPDNILIGADRRPRVTDFGVARALADEAAETLDASTFVGSYPYMAPEQSGYCDPARGLHARARGRAADVYSLGAIMYELVRGAPPYPVRSRPALFAAFASGAPPALHGWARGADYDLEAVILKALSHDPAARYATAAAFAEDLRRTLAGRAPLARLPRWHKRFISAIWHHAMWLGISLAAFSISAAAVLTAEQRSQTTSHRQALQSASTLGLIFVHAASVARQLAEDPLSATTLAHAAQATPVPREEAWLARIGRDKLINTAFLITSGGRAVAHYPVEREAYYQLDFSDRLYLRGTRLGPQGFELGAFVSPLFYSRARDAVHKLAFSTPVYSEQGLLLGAAVVTVRLDTLLDATDPAVTLIAPHERATGGDGPQEELVRVARRLSEQPLLLPLDSTRAARFPIANTRYQCVAAPRAVWRLIEDGLLLGVLALGALCTLALWLARRGRTEHAA